jgi:hypothetical protein
MDVFCPNCLHNVTLESREPGRYTFDCPECAAEAAVTIPVNPGERPLVRPVRPQSGHSDSQVAKPRSTRDSALPKSSLPPSSLPKSSDDIPLRTPPPQPKAKPRVSNGPVPRKPTRMDFPFEASDKNLGESRKKAPKDEFDSPEYEIPQPLRPAAIREILPDEPPPRRKKKKEVKFETYLMGMLAAAGVWFLLFVASLYLRQFAWGMIVVGSVALTAARRTFLRVARKEDPMVWLACLLVPFYTLIFGLAHFRQTATAFWISLVGYGFLVSGIMLFAVHGVVDAVNKNRPAVVASDDDDADADEAMKKGAAAKFGSDNITLSIDGKESRIHVDRLALSKPKVNRKDEEFEFSGPDVSLRGSFAPTFHHDWQELVEEDVNVPIVAKSDQREPGESHVKLPGRGLVKVTGGAFSVSRALPGDEPTLYGILEIETTGPEGPETIRGTFSVRVKAAK